MELRIELTKREQKAQRVVAYRFCVHRGYFSISEEWPSADEIYTANNVVAVPPRIWREAYPWIVSNTKPKK